MKYVSLADIAKVLGLEKTTVRKAVKRLGFETILMVTKESNFQKALVMTASNAKKFISLRKTYESQIINVDKL